MRRAIRIGLFSLLMTMPTGCFVNMYSSDPIRRYQQLFYQSEDLRLLEDDIELFWQIDQPSWLTPLRVSGLGDPPARRFRLSDQDRGGFEQRFMK